MRSALNAHHIAKRSSPVPNNACAGGAVVTIVLTPERGAPVQLGGYRCADQTFGDIGGDLPGFLAAVGVSG